MTFCGRGGRVIATLLVWLAMAATSTAAPGESESMTAAAYVDSSVPGLAIRIEPTVPQGERIYGWIEERAQAVLGARAQPLEAEDVVRVAVRGGSYDYRVQIVLVRHGQLIAGQPAVLVCECGSDEMLEKVGEAIGAGADQLSAVAAEERAAAERAIAEEREERERERQKAGGAVNERSGKVRLRPLGYAGIGVGVLGTGLLVAGIPLSLRPMEVREANDTYEGYTTRPAGISLAVVGSAVLTAGISLLVIDLVRHREPAVALVPAVGPRHAGLSVARKF